MRSLCFPWMLLLGLVSVVLNENRLLAQPCAPFSGVKNMAPMPEAVSNNAVCEGYVNGKAYVYSFAGIDTSKSHDGIHLRSWRYDVENDAWQALPDLPDTLGKVASGASYLNGIVYIIGGYHVFDNGSEVSSKRVHRFDCASNTFLSDAADLPLAIDDHVQAIWRDSLMYVITGWSNSANTSAVQVYDPSTDSWTLEYQIWNGGIYSSFGASGTIIGDTIYYFGGARFGANFPIQPQLRIGVINPTDPLDISWSHIQMEDSSALYRPACINMNGTPHWIGGSRITYNYDGIAYSDGSGVSPAGALEHPEDSTMIISACESILMDYRGQAWFPERGELYLCGGMAQGQEVSNQCLLLETTPLSVSEALNSEPLCIYPNPTGDQFFINSQEAGTVSIYDVEGRLLDRFQKQKGPEAFATSGPGVLSVVVQTSAGVYRQKVVVVR